MTFATARGPCLLGALLMLLALTACVSAANGAATMSCSTGAPIALPIRVQEKAALIPVSLPTGHAVLMLDTGSDITNFSRAAAARLNIPLDPMHTLPGQTVGGPVNDGIGMVSDLRIGALHIPHMQVAITDTTPAEGVLGLDVLQQFDVDFDLAHGRVTLYPGGLCEGQFPPWTGRFQTLPAVRSVIGRTFDGGSATKPYLMVTMALNQRSAEAMLDTGALLNGLVSPGYAGQLGLDGTTLARDPQATAGGFGPETSLSMHRFDTLEIGTDIIRHPILAVGGAAERFPLVLGMDMFMSHRIWMSFSTDRVFLKSP